MKEQRQPMVILVGLCVIGLVTLTQCGKRTGLAPSAPPATVTSAPPTTVMATVAPTGTTVEPDTSPEPSMPSPQPTSISPTLQITPMTATVRKLQPQAPTDTLQSGLENFVFSAPYAIGEKLFLHLEEWLPDSQRLLVIKCISPCVYPGNEAFGTYNVNTDEFQEYGRRHDQPPFYIVWLPGLQMVAFAESGVWNGQEWISRGNLWISGRGAEQATEPALTNLEYWGHPAATDSEVVVVISPTHQLATINPTGQINPLPVDVRQLGPVNPWNRYLFRMMSNPDRSIVTLHGSFGYIYLVHLADYHAQAIYLGDDFQNGAVEKATWSPDGNYLALTNILPGNRPYGLWILDVRSGELVMLDVRPWLATWAPDSRHLIFTNYEDPDNHVNLFLADRQTGAVTPILPDGTVPEACANVKDQVVWSPDGNRIGLKVQGGALCLVDVTIQEK
jgi:hypothetical protein